MSPIHFPMLVSSVRHDQAQHHLRRCEGSPVSQVCYSTLNFHFMLKCGRPFGFHRRLIGYAYLAESAQHRCAAFIKAGFAVNFRMGCSSPLSLRVTSCVARGSIVSNGSRQGRTYISIHTFCVQEFQKHDSQAILSFVQRLIHRSLLTSSSQSVGLTASSKTHCLNLMLETHRIDSGPKLGSSSLLLDSHWSLTSLSVYGRQ
jgi:hypothetical protein